MLVSHTFTDNRYRLIRLLGNGGMARVYLAHDEVLARDVALKVLREQYADHEEFVERFRREARSAGALSHPHIVQIYDRGRSADGSYYMTMEYLPGGTLKGRILREGALPSHDAAGLALQIAGALGLAHEKGVIHRDVKPQNILLTTAGNAKVADFGIAHAASATALSGTSMILGTAGYMSPEQAMGKPVGPASDLYSLGVVLYEMLTGALPYEAETPIGLALRHINEAPRPPKEANPSVPESLNDVTTRLLAKHPEDRYASADELIRDLQRIRAGLPPLAAPPADAQETTTLPRSHRRAADTSPSRSRERSRRKLAGFAAALLASLVLLGGLALALSDNLPTARKATEIGGENTGAEEDLAVNPVEEQSGVEDSEAESQTQEKSSESDTLPSPPAEQSAAQSVPATPPAETIAPAPVAAAVPVVSKAVPKQTTTPQPAQPAAEAKQQPAAEESQEAAPRQAAPKQAAPKQAAPKQAATKQAAIKPSTTPQPARAEKSEEDTGSEASKDAREDEDRGPVGFGPDGPIKSKSDRAKKD